MFKNGVLLESEPKTSDAKHDFRQRVKILTTPRGGSEASSTQGKVSEPDLSISRTSQGASMDAQM